MQVLAKYDYKEIVEIIKQKYIETGLPPSIRSLIEITGLAGTTIERRLHLAVRHGLLTQSDNGQYVPVPDFGRETLWR
jgi:DNA-binding IclR family transcriptional regulator